MARDPNKRTIQEDVMGFASPLNTTFCEGNQIDYLKDIIKQKEYLIQRQKDELLMLYRKLSEKD